MREVNDLDFPSIDATLPVGTQMVSDIDDAERETRQWLLQSLKVISGYPDVNTVGVKTWTDSTRPTTNPNENYLLGFNTDSEELELVDLTGESIKPFADISTSLKKEIALLAHPVGEYYWTSDSSFNPANEWGGTWERIQDGRVLISNNSSHAVGSTGGAETVTLSLSQLPPYTHSHAHTRGTMDITGSFIQAAHANYVATGAFYMTGTWAGNCAENSDSRPVAGFSAARSWTGSTSSDSFSFGGGQSHNNMQPYRTAICWHRTA